MKNDSLNLMTFVQKKLKFYKGVIQNTFYHIQKNKVYDILRISEYSLCINKLNELSYAIIDLDKSLICSSTKDALLKSLQTINNELSALFKEFGTNYFEDLLMVCLGEQKFLSMESNDDISSLLKQFFHPIGYKIITRKSDLVLKNKDKNIISFQDDHEITSNFECIDISSEFNQFAVKLNGIKVVLNYEHNKTIIVFGILDEIIIDLLDNKFISNMKNSIKNNVPDQAEFQNDTFTAYIRSLCLKDYIICKEYSDIYTKYSGYVNFNNSVKQKHISNIVKDYSKDDLYGKRNTILMLLLNNNNLEHDYLAYLLYDLLSNDTSGSVDTHEQILIFDSFPLPIKNNFKSAMKKTIHYSTDLSNFDLNNVPFEQQICLLNADSKVKEKALNKLKEIKNKSEDSGVKARQYVEGILKIPFNIYKKEPILYVINELSYKICFLKKKYCEITFEIGNSLNNIDILNFNNYIENFILEKKNLDNCLIEILDVIKNYDKKSLNIIILSINDILNQNDLSQYLLTKNYLKKNLIQNSIIQLATKVYNESDIVFFQIYYLFFPNLKLLFDDIKQISDKVLLLKNFNSISKDILDKSVHGHDNAKRQVQRVIGQWINNNGISCECQVLGFEGNPGVGKTTLAKGLSNCLIDENGHSRPFQL